MGECDHIGNFTNYEAKTHFAQAFRAIQGENCVVKPYSLSSNKEEFPGEAIRTAYIFLVDSLLEGKIESKLGMGFMIVSDGFINVNMWGGDYPSLINTSLFEFDIKKGRDQGFNPVDIAKSGPFCVWELGIVAHEAAAWRRYLQSKKENADKLQYLTDRFTGTISV